MPTVLVWQTLAGTMRTRNDNGHPIFAALYDWLGGAAERGWMGRRRSRLLAEASGSVLEIGGGTGANLAHYREAAYVVVAEPDPFMRGKLRRKLGAARVPVEVSEAGAEALPFSDGSFDAVVSTLVLCTVPDQGVALAEIRRVLRPGGRLLFIEHVRGEGSVAGVQDRILPVWKRLLRDFSSYQPLTRLRTRCFLRRDVLLGFRTCLWGRRP